jgi:hypothetical protein
MPAAPADWEQITPEQLVPAIRHIRKSFDGFAWTCDTVTWKLCYTALAALDPQQKESPHWVADTDDRTSFVKYLKIVGSASEQQFHDSLRGRTPPSVLKAYMDVYQRGMEIGIRNHFEATVKIGLAHQEMLTTHPVDWTESLLRLLIQAHTSIVKLWIRQVCGKSCPEGIEEEEQWDRRILGEYWRAPRLILMKPFADTKYDPVIAWTLEDRPESQQLLDGFAKRFTQSLGFYLDKIAGNAHVLLAQNEYPDASQQSGGRTRSISRAPIVETEGQETFTHSDDYCLITYRGEKYKLTSAAGQVVRMLHNAHMARKTGVGSAEIKRHLRCGRVWDQFRRRDGRRFWSALIQKDGKDFFKLNLGPFVDPPQAPRRKPPSATS